MPMRRGLKQRERKTERGERPHPYSLLVEDKGGRALTTAELNQVYPKYQRKKDLTVNMGKIVTEKGSTRGQSCFMTVFPESTE